MIIFLILLSCIISCGQQQQSSLTEHSDLDSKKAEETKSQDQIKGTISAEIKNPELCSDSQDAVSTDEIRLKGASLLSRSFNNVLGPKFTTNIVNSNENLLETYQSSFGGVQGLGYGNIYADKFSESSQMTGYFLALNTVAYNAALQCDYQNRAGKCACDSEEKSLEMLSKAIPYKNFCFEENYSFVQEFTQLCKTDYIDTITALLASVAFAKRN